MSRILVVDDDAQQLDLHKQLLEIAGYQVEIALTASQTVRRLENAPADLVIMDLRLPNALGEPDPRRRAWRSSAVSAISATASPSIVLSRLARRSVWPTRRTAGLLHPAQAGQDPRIPRHDPRPSCRRYLVR